MMKMMTSYPYVERARPLRDLGPGGEELNGAIMVNPFRAFTTLLGSICRGGGESVDSRVSAIVQGRHHAEEITAPTSSPMPPAELQYAQPLIVRGSDSEEEDPKLPRYTMALKEFGDRRGLAVTWPTHELSYSPLKFRCVTQVGGGAFEGVAGSKRKARHLASRRACQSLNIVV